jgi:hypothetical protein
MTNKINYDELFNKFNGLKVLIVGDVMVDNYIIGKVDRVSPEAPVPVVDVTSFDSRLGGAGNVALNIKAMGGIPILCSVIGNDKEALSSDAGKQMTAAATGSEVYPPEVLQKIAVQIHGEMESKDKLGQATDKYARKYGENNMASFSQMWDSNSDSKVFELMSLPKLIKNKELRGKMAEQIIGYPPGSEERTKIEQQYMNIQKLIKDGHL